MASSSFKPGDTSSGAISKALAAPAKNKKAVTYALARAPLSVSSNFSFSSMGEGKHVPLLDLDSDIIPVAVAASIACAPSVKSKEMSELDRIMVERATYEKVSQMNNKKDGERKDEGLDPIRPAWA